MNRFKILTHFLLIFQLFVNSVTFSAELEVSSGCLSTARVYLHQGSLEDEAVGAKTWHFPRIARTLRAHQNPNGCMGEILGQAVTDSREYWRDISRRYGCQNSDSRHYNVAPCRNSGNFTDAESNLTYLDSMEILYAQHGDRLIMARYCNDELPILEESLIRDLRRTQVHVVNSSAPENFYWLPEDGYAGNSCLQNLSCMDRIKISSITARLDSLARSSGLNEASLRTILTEELQGLDSASQIRIAKAITAHALKETIPQDDMELLGSLRRGNDFIEAEMATFRRRAQEFVDLNSRLQERADSSFFQRAGLFFSMALGDIENNPLMQSAVAYRSSGEALMRRLDEFLAGDESLSQSDRERIRERFEESIRQVSDQLRTELSQTHHSIDSARHEMTMVAGGVLVGGLSVAGAGLALGGTAFGVLGVEGATGIAALVGSAGSMATQGAAVAGATNLLRRAVAIAGQGIQSGPSLYCRAIEQEMESGGLNLVGEAAAGGTVSALFGTGLGAVIARAGNWQGAAGAVVALGSAGVGATQVVQSHTSQMQALDRLESGLTSSQDRACVDHARTMVRAGTALDVGAFALELFGGAAHARVRGPRPAKVVPAPPTPRPDPVIAPTVAGDSVPSRPRPAIEMPSPPPQTVDDAVEARTVASDETPFWGGITTLETSRLLFFGSNPRSRSSSIANPVSKRVQAPDGKSVEMIYTGADYQYAKSRGHIFENISTSELPPGEYTHVVLDDGTMRFGRVFDSWEYGTKHYHLAQGQPVISAGEISIRADGCYSWNLESGTFTRKLVDDGVSMTELRRVMDDIFSAEMLRSGDYTAEAILPSGRETDASYPDEDEMRRICSQFNPELTSGLAYIFARFRIKAANFYFISNSILSA